MWKPVRETSISTLHFSYIQLVSVVRGERLLRLTGAVSANITYVGSVFAATDFPVCSNGTKLGVLQLTGNTDPYLSCGSTVNFYISRKRPRQIT